MGSLDNYVVITSRNKDEFEKEVVSYVQKGYKFIGGVSIALTKNDHIQYAQSMYFIPSYKT